MYAALNEHKSPPALPRRVRSVWLAGATFHVILFGTYLNIRFFGTEVSHTRGILTLLRRIDFSRSSLSTARPHWRTRSGAGRQCWRVRSGSGRGDTWSG